MASWGVTEEKALRPTKRARLFYIGWRAPHALCRYFLMILTWECETIPAGDRWERHNCRATGGTGHRVVLSPRYWKILVAENIKSEDLAGDRPLPKASVPPQVCKASARPVEPLDISEAGRPHGTAHFEHLPVPQRPWRSLMYLLSHVWVELDSGYFLGWRCRLSVRIPNGFARSRFSRHRCPCQYGS